MQLLRAHGLLLAVLTQSRTKITAARLFSALALDQSQNPDHARPIRLSNYLCRVAFATP